MQRVKYYDENTGNPTVDNEARNRNRAVNKVALGGFTVNTSGRRRKKYIMSQEFPRYVSLIAYTADIIATGVIEV